MAGDDAPTSQTTETRTRTAANAPIGSRPARDGRRRQLSLAERVHALQRSTLMRPTQPGSGTTLTAR